MVLTSIVDWGRVKKNFSFLRFPFDGEFFKKSFEREEGGFVLPNGKETEFVGTTTMGKLVSGGIG
jgi:hypothetical protein